MDVNQMLFYESLRLAVGPMLKLRLGLRIQGQENVPDTGAGFQMNPSKDLCEQYLWNNDVDVVAMSTLAAGYLKPSEAYEYLFSLPNVASVVVGVSTAEHADETFRVIREKRDTRASG